MKKLRSALLAGVVGLTLLAVAACGSSSKGGTTPPTSAGAPAPTSGPASGGKSAATTAATSPSMSMSMPSSKGGTSSAPSAKPSTSGGSSTSSPDTVTINNFKFQLPASVQAGAKITVTNQDSTDHTFSDKGNAFDVTVKAKSSATLTAPKAGSYSVYCKFHPYMTGTLVVK